MSNSFKNSFVQLSALIFIFGVLAAPIHAQEFTLNDLRSSESIGLIETEDTPHSEDIWRHSSREELFTFLNGLPDHYIAPIYESFVGMLTLKASPKRAKNTETDFYAWRLEKLLKLGAYEKAERLFEAREDITVSSKAIELGYLASLYQGKIDKVCLNLKLSPETKLSFKTDIVALCDFHINNNKKFDDADVKLKEWHKEDITPITIEEFDALPAHLKAIAVSQYLTDMQLDRGDTKIKELSNDLLWLMWNSPSEESLRFVETMMLHRGLLKSGDLKQSKGKYLVDAIQSRLKTAHRIQKPAYLVPVLSSLHDLDMDIFTIKEQLSLKLAQHLYESELSQLSDKQIESDHPIVLTFMNKQLELDKIKDWHNTFCTAKNGLNSQECVHILLILRAFHKEQPYDEILNDVIYGKKSHEKSLTNYVIPSYTYVDSSRYKDKKREKFDLSLLKMLEYSKVPLHSIDPKEWESIYRTISLQGKRKLAIKMALYTLIGIQ